MDYGIILSCVGALDSGGEKSTQIRKRRKIMNIRPVLFAVAAIAGAVGVSALFSSCSKDEPFLSASASADANANVNITINPKDSVQTGCVPMIRPYLGDKKDSIPNITTTIVPVPDTKVQAKNRDFFETIGLLNTQQDNDSIVTGMKFKYPWDNTKQAQIIEDPNASTDSKSVYNVSGLAVYGNDNSFSGQMTQEVTDDNKFNTKIGNTQIGLREYTTAIENGKVTQRKPNGDFFRQFTYTQLNSNGIGRNVYFNTPLDNGGNPNDPVNQYETSFNDVRLIKEARPTTEKNDTTWTYTNTPQYGDWRSMTQEEIDAYIAAHPGISTNPCDW